MSALSENKSLKNWLLLVILSYTAFIFNTTEFVPIGLLSDIARDFGMREANASILISVYAGFVAVMSLPLVIIIGRCDFRKILLFVIAGFMISHFLSSVASNFTVLLISRLGVACSHAACGTHCPQGQERNCSWHDNYRHFACYDSRYAAGARYRPSPWMEVYIRRYRHCGTVGISAAGVPFSACAQQTKHFGEEPAVAVQIAGNNGHIHFHIARCNCALHRIQLH